MYLVVGLGNPGPKYDGTRHNIGFDLIDKMSEVYKVDVDRTKFKGIYGSITIGFEKVILLKPLTYMNLSGESVGEIARYYKIPNENIIVAHDDASIDVGRLRLRRKGSAGGQNGIKNIIQHLGTDEFTRVKIGVGKPKGDMVSHVLGKFSTDERPIAAKTVDESVRAVECIVREGVDTAMNKFNSFDATQV